MKQGSEVHLEAPSQVAYPCGCSRHYCPTHVPAYLPSALPVSVDAPAPRDQYLQRLKESTATLVDRMKQADMSRQGPLGTVDAPAQDGAQAPPGRIVEKAIERAKESPCRSKRGAVVFRENLSIGSGHNHKSAGFECDGSAECKSNCRSEAVHAEQHALLRAGLHAQGAEMLHVKVVDGQLVPSGGPSCAQCSKLALAAGVTAMWLYHEDGWRRYGIAEFHRLSLLATPRSPSGDRDALMEQGYLRHHDYCDRQSPAFIFRDERGKYVGARTRQESDPPNTCTCGLDAVLAGAGASLKDELHGRGLDCPRVVADGAGEAALDVRADAGQVIADLTAKLAIEHQAANHWFKEANAEHNRAEKLERKLDEAGASRSAGEPE